MMREATLSIRIFRFIAGFAILGLAVLFFASGMTPPGICGEVLRHNQACNIDASPLFYSEVENMSDLEAGVRQMRAEAINRQDSKVN